MKKFVIVLCLLLSLVGCNKAEKKYVERALAVANSATNYLYQRNDSEFYLLLDSDAKNHTTVESLSDEFDTLVKYYGNIREINTEDMFYTAGNDILVNVPVCFTTGWMDIQYKINKEGSVKSFILMPSDMLEDSEYDENVLDYCVDEIQENYVLTTPSSYNKETPIVLMLHDKDALDWDYTIGVNRIFKLITYQLVDNDIATIRYDRLGNSHEVVDTKDQLLAEVKQIVESFKNTEYYQGQKIYLLGYGVAGYLLPYLASDVDVQGYIIANGYSTNLAQCLSDQQKYLIDNDLTLSDQMKKERLSQIDASLNVINNLVTPEDYEYKLLGYSTTFWLDIANYDVFSYSETLDKPMFVIGCDKDYQVDSYQFNNWKHYLKGKSNVEYSYLKNVDHYFLSRKSSKPTDIYSQGNISQTLIKELVKFLGENK